MSEMNVRVLVFAAAREVVGASELELTLAVGATAGDALGVLCARWPGLAPYAGSLRLAVNGDYVARDHALVAGDEVAVIPPVAGG
jgi:molybdopterin synthase catalytic subunit/molybdopterin synthase sulfur carrier subunit